MITVKQAQSEIIWFINGDGFAKSTSIYEYIKFFEDREKMLRSIYKENFELNEETGNYEDNGKWRLIYCHINRPTQLLSDEFETEEDADNEILNRIYYDFEKSCAEYFSSEKEAELVIIERMADEYSIDPIVAESIFRKKKIVFDIRQTENAIHQAMITKEREQRKKWLSIAVPAEADSIIIDSRFKDALLYAETANGYEKSKRMASAMKWLLQRNGLTEIKTDFWQVLRLLKAKAEIE